MTKYTSIRGTVLEATRYRLRKIESDLRVRIAGEVQGYPRNGKRYGTQPQ